MTTLLCTPTPSVDPVKYPEKPSAFIQVNRTIPPYTCFSAQPIDNIIVDGEAGELGSLNSYIKAITNARKFIMISEQYFFNQEIAVAIREALVREDGPEFVIIVLPQELDESTYVDPLFFRLRKKALDILRYGFQPNPLSTNSCDERMALGSDSSLNFSSRIALLSLVNHDGKNIYTHSKHLIVDDVWMTAGSANMSNRGMTYEMEINAAVVGQKLYEGGTNIVRDQRIELCRRLLGLPKAYTAALEDPYSAFRLLKAIEGQQDSYSLNVYPLKPLVKWLDSEYVKRVPGDAAFDAAVDVVLNMDVNGAPFNFLVCSLLDADGRRHDPDRLGYLAHMVGKGKVLSQAMANLSLNFSDDCKQAIKIMRESNDDLKMAINAIIFTPDEDDETIFIPNGPFMQHEFSLEYDSDEKRVEFVEQPSTNFSVTISPKHTVSITAVITNETTNQTLSCGGEIIFNSNPDNPTVEYGQEYDGIINITD